MKLLKRGFVALIAMVMIATAFGGFVPAQAAGTPKLNVKSKILFIGGSKVTSNKETYTIKLKNKPSSYFVSWTSSDESVATVEKLKSGKAKISAHAIGKTTVTASLYDKKSKASYELSCKITVKKNCDTVLITPATADPIYVGDTLSLKGQMYNADGSVATKGKDVTDSIKWQSSDTDIATVSSTGLVTAKKAGTCTLTCYAVQATTGANASLAKAVSKKTIDITVKAKGIVSARQTALNKIEIVFGSNISSSIKLEDIKLTSGTSGSTIVTKDLTFDRSGQIATLTTASELNEGVTYTIACGTATQSFKASKGTPVAMQIYTEFNENQAVAGRYTKLKFRLLNSDGVDITPLSTTSSEYTSYLSCVSYKLLQEGSWFVSGDTIYVESAGKSIPVKGTFSRTYAEGGTVKTQTFDYLLNISTVSYASTLILDNITITSSTGAGSSLDWEKPRDYVSLSDEGYKIVARVIAPDGSYLYSNASDSKLTISTATDSVVAVFESGVMFPFKEGTESVIVKYDGDVVGVRQINIREKRKATSVLFDDNGTLVSNVNLSNVYEIGECKLGVTVLDQFGDILPIEYSSSAANTATNLTTSIVGSSSTYNYPSAQAFGDTATALTTGTSTKGYIDIIPWGYGSVAGTGYQYTVKYSSPVYGEASGAFSVIVYAPDTTKPSTYSVEVTGPKDLALTSALAELPKLTVTMYELKGSVKNSKISNIYPSNYSVTEGDYFYELYDAQGKLVTNGIENNQIKLVYTKSGSSSLTKYATGTYSLRVYQKVSGNKVLRTTTTFTLTDSSAVPIATRKADTTSRVFYDNESCAVNAFLDCYDVKMSDDSISVSSVSIPTGKYMYNTNAFIIYEINVCVIYNIGSNNYLIEYPLTLNTVIRHAS